MTFLGLDVGGTNCRFEWWPTGELPGALPGGDARAVQPAVHGVEATVAGLGEALAVAARTAAPTAAVCALAGVGERGLADTLVAGLRARGVTFPVAVVGDVLAAAAAALANGPGLLLWAGTGSFAIARAADGQLHRIGGRGYLLGDQGSGYDLVRRAAAAVLAAHDDLGPPTVLTATLPQAFAAPAPQRLGAVLQRLDSGQVAAQLPVVLAAAANGDAVANAVLAAGLQALGELAAAAVLRAQLSWRGLPVAFGGGVLLGVPDYAARLAAHLQELGAQAPQRIEPRAAARGAAWLAHGWHHRLEPQSSWVQRVAI